MQIFSDNLMEQYATLVNKELPPDYNLQLKKILRNEHRVFFGYQEEASSKLKNLCKEIIENTDIDTKIIAYLSQTKEESWHNVANNIMSKVPNLINMITKENYYYR